MRCSACLMKLIMGCFLCVSVLQAQMPSAEDNRNIQRQTISGEQVRNMKSSDLIDLYGRVLNEQHVWAAGKTDKLVEEIAVRKDPALDQKLAALADRVLHEDEAKGRLDSLAGKRSLSRTEEVLNLLGRRKTEFAYEYVFSQVTNKHSVVRACIVDALGPSGWNASYNRDVILRVSRLLRDDDPEVSYRSAMALVRQIASGYLISEHALRALVDARDATAKGVPVVNGSFDLRDALDAAVEKSREILTKAQEKAGPEERKELNRLLDIFAPQGQGASGEN